MAGTNLGTAWIQIKPSMKGMTSSIKQELSNVGSAEGQNVGSKFSTGFAAKMGIVSGITQQVFSKVSNVISGQLSDAIYRADTLNRFPKVMQMMGYSADDATKAVEKLRDGVKGIPTSLADVVSGTQRLAGVTKDLDKASSWTLALSDAMLVTTGDVNQASRGMEQFMQILASGKVDGQAWNTIMEVSSPIMEELAHTLGYTSAAMGGDFYTALQKGTLSIDKMMGALVKLDTEGGNGLESLKERVKGSTGGIEATMTSLRQAVSNALVDIIQEIGSGNIEGIINGIKDVLKNLLGIVKNVIVFLKDNWEWMGPMIGVIATVAGIVIGINAALNAWNATQKAVNAIQLVFNAILNANPIFLLATVIAGVVAALTWFFTQTETGKAIIEGFGQVVGQVFGSIGEFVSGVWNNIVQGAQNVWNNITSIFSNLANFFGTIFGTAWTVVKNVFSTGGKIFMGIVDGITNAFKAIVNAIITGINHVVAIPFNAINGFLNVLKGIDIFGLKPFDWVGTINVPQIPLLATGGIVTGVGTDTSDSNLYALSKGEYVVNAAAARKIGYDNLDKMNRDGEISGGDQYNYFTINGYNKSPEELANMISRKIAFNQRGVLG